MKITYDADGSLDEVFASSADGTSVHLERISKFRYTLIIRDADGHLILDVTRPTVYEYAPAPYDPATAPAPPLIQPEND